jgi:hypothetical protein
MEKKFTMAGDSHQQKGQRKIVNTPLPLVLVGLYRHQ